MKLSHRKKRLSKHGLWWPIQRQTVSFEARILRQAWSHARIGDQPKGCIVDHVTRHSAETLHSAETRHSAANKFKMALARISVFLSRATTKSEKNR